MIFNRLTVAYIPHPIHSPSKCSTFGVQPIKLAGAQQGNQCKISSWFLAGFEETPWFLSKEKNQTLKNFDKMNVKKKEWFCYQCSLQFDSQHVYGLHLKLMHKHINAKRSNKNKLKTIEQISIDENSDSIIQIISY